MPNQDNGARRPFLQRLAPGLSLMILAPLIAELLPGATRLSSAFVFPIEVIIWGGGALIARELTCRRSLGWVGLVLLALALSVAEECLIQQTSFAPLVVKIQGVEYARAFGVNYVYLLWALLYESLFVVVIPVGLSHLLFAKRAGEPWLNWIGASLIGLFFVPACFAAWYGWNQIARVQVFHLEPYNLPAHLAVAGVVGIAVLIGTALLAGPAWSARFAKPLPLPHPALLFLLAAAVSVALFALEVLAFGIAPAVPPIFAVALAAIVAVGLLMVPRWRAAPAWQAQHEFAALYGATLSNLAITFVGFGDNPLDLYGKIAMDVLAALLLLVFWRQRGGFKADRAAVPQP